MASSGLAVFRARVTAIAGAELLQQHRNGVLVALGVLMTVLLGATASARIVSYRAQDAIFRDAARRVREQWVSQGSRHPHSGAHFGTYVFRRGFPLEVLEPGIGSYTGSVFPLVTHERDFPTDVPILSTTALTLYGELAPSVIGMALLSLFAVIVGYGAVAAERESGTIRLLLASGCSPGAIILGKFVGLGCALLILWLVKTVCEAVVVAFASAGSFPAGEQWIRFAGYEGVHFMYASVWLAGTVAASTWIRQSRVVLAVLLSFWIGNTILLPRIASSVVRLILPEPSSEEFYAAIRHDIAFRPDGSEWVNEWSKKLVADTLRNYGVSKIEDLPVGYAGIMLKSSDAHYEEVFGRHFDRLHRLHERQQQWHHALSFLGPWIASRALLEGFAGSDLENSAHFSDAAESYRRMFVNATNDAAERRGKGAGWEVEVGRDYWTAIPDFSYRFPPVSWTVRQHILSIAVLGLWVAVAATGLVAATRRADTWT